MKVSELGEFGLIDLLAKKIGSGQDERLIIGIGDDAAAWYSDTSAQLATIDSFIQDVHFCLDTASWQDIGWKALAASLSDIAAMGGVPRYALVSLALPDHTEVEAVTSLYQGMIELARHYEVTIVGGNISRSPLVTIVVTILGSSQRQDKSLLTRSAAVSGDKIAVTGYLGAAAAGSEMLINKLQFDPETTASLSNAFLHPCPRIAEGQLLAEQGVKTAIDISDGLISDLNQICKASQVGARIEVDRVPILPAVKANFGDRALELALSGGEDYELLFTASDEVINKVKEAISCPVTVIGEMVTNKLNKVTLIDKKGNPVNLNRAGWEHFVTG
jgi:thiamine-monophosphate kinase